MLMEIMKKRKLIKIMRRRMKMKMRGGGGPLKEEGGEGDSKVARGPPTVASFLAESPQIRGKEGLRQLGGKHWVSIMMMMSSPPWRRRQR